MQVIAPGFQTFGDDYTINQSEQVVTIRLKRPQDQYTIYDKHGKGAATGGAVPKSSTPPDNSCERGIL